MYSLCLSRMTFLGQNAIQKICESMKKFLQTAILNDSLQTVPEVYHMFVQALGIIVQAHGESTWYHRDTVNCGCFKYRNRIDRLQANSYIVTICRHSGYRRRSVDYNDMDTQFKLVTSKLTRSFSIN